MDRLIYTAMSGASSILDRQSIVANNLANVNTPGFRADISQSAAAPVTGAGLATRAQVTSGVPATDFTPGVVNQTGSPLDVAIPGAGFLTVQSADGSEAYTRAGNLQISADGTLTSQGLPVVGSGGPITIPPDSTISISQDGTVYALPTKPPFNAASPVGQLKLVNPPTTALIKGQDGLFRSKDGGDLDADPTVKVESGALEGSNVNTADVMVNMISLAREFEMQMKMMQSAQDNAQQASQLLSAN